MVTTFLRKKAVGKIKTSQTYNTHYNNNKKELKGYYTKESHWLLTFLLSQKIDFITFFLS